MAAADAVSVVGAGGGNAKSLFPAQSERYRWSKWRFKSGNELRDFIRDEVFPYMASLAKDEPEVAEGAAAGAAIRPAPPPPADRAATSFRRLFQPR